MARDSGLEEILNESLSGIPDIFLHPRSLRAIARTSGQASPRLETPCERVTLWIAPPCYTQLLRKLWPSFAIRSPAP